MVILDPYGTTFNAVGVFGLAFHLLFRSWSTYCALKQWKGIFLRGRMLFWKYIKVKLYQSVPQTETKKIGLFSWLWVPICYSIDYFFTGLQVETLEPSDIVIQLYIALKLLWFSIPRYNFLSNSKLDFKISTKQIWIEVTYPCT